MSNHYHLVLHVDATQAHRLSDDEVAERWLGLFKGPLLVQRYQQGEALSSAEVRAVKDILNVCRGRLCDISWFIRCLNEHVARRANEEDKCSGRFWRDEERMKKGVKSRFIDLGNELNPKRAILTFIAISRERHSHL